VCGTRRAWWVSEDRRKDGAAGGTRGGDAARDYPPEHPLNPAERHRERERYFSPVDARGSLGPSSCPYSPKYVEKLSKKSGRPKTEASEVYGRGQIGLFRYGIPAISTCVTPPGDLLDNYSTPLGV
jgi:hypothetical protein